MDSETNEAGARNHSNSNVIKLVGFDQPFFTALAVVLSLGCLLYTMRIDHEEQQRVYFANRTEAFIEQLAFEGYKVPRDLLPPDYKPKEK